MGNLDFMDDLGSDENGPRRRLDRQMPNAGSAGGQQQSGPGIGGGAPASGDMFGRLIAKRDVDAQDAAEQVPSANAPTTVTPQVPQGGGYPDPGYGYDTHYDDQHGHDQYEDQWHPDDQYHNDDDHEYDDGEQVTPRSRRHHQELTTGSQRKGRTGLALGILAAVLGVVLLAGFWFARPVLGTLFAEDFSGPGGDSVQVVIAPGSSGTAIGQTLTDAGVIASAGAFKKAAKANSKSSGIQPGTYSLPSGIPASEAVTLLLSKDSKDVWTIQIKEGERSNEVFALASQVTGIPVADFEAAVQDPAVGLPEPPAGTKDRAEGYMFPATYTFDVGVTAVDIVKTMYDRFKQEMVTLGIPQDRQHEILVKASIVQAEGRLESDMPKIARVIDNRLAKPQRLQMDSTVSYWFGLREVETSSAQRATDFPYNTYMHDGLPAGPICNPGAATLKAALNPEPGPWLYFLAVNTLTGETKFAESYDQHLVHLQEWKDWAAATGGEDGQ